jgi:hypothetical protein
MSTGRCTVCNKRCVAKTIQWRKAAIRGGVNPAQGPLGAVDPAETKTRQKNWRDPVEWRQASFLPLPTDTDWTLDGQEVSIAGV